MSADPERIGEGGGGGLAVASDAWMELDTNRRQGNRDDTSSVPTTPTSEAAAAAAAAAECSLASCRQSAVRSSGDDQSTYMNLRHKCNRKPVQEHCRPKRETARSMCRPLKQWLYSHRDQPYPSRADKLQLASDSKMTVVQVSNWFANARRRLKKTGHPPAGSSSSPPSAAGPPVVSWEQRFKLYNRNVVGNQERLSISSDESEMDDFNSDDDEAVSAGSAKPCSTSSGNFSGEEKDFPARSSGEGRAAAVAAAAGLLLPGKFKQGILHRYLSDSYRMSFVRGSGGVGGGGGEMDRVRKMSGSPTSRDSALSTSCRSTPVRDQQNDESFERVDVYSSEHFQSQGENADYELESLELSAVHVLASLAASNRNLRTNS